jgi:hypothetical protein
MLTLEPTSETAKTAVPHVEAIKASLPRSHEWDERERTLLHLAVRQAADIDRLEADIEARGVRVPGRGGEVLNQAIAEVRQARVVLARILGQVDVPESLSPRSLHGRKAAEVRWQKRAG